MIFFRPCLDLICSCSRKHASWIRFYIKHCQSMSFEGIIFYYLKKKKQLFLQLHYVQVFFMFSKPVVRSSTQEARKSLVQIAYQTKQICNSSRILYESHSSFPCLRLKTTQKAPLLFHCYSERIYY